MAADLSCSREGLPTTQVATNKNIVKMNAELFFFEGDEEFAMIQSQRNLWKQFEKSQTNEQEQPSPSSTTRPTSKPVSKYQVSAPHDDGIIETMDEYDIAMMLQDKVLIDEQQRIFQMMMMGEEPPPLPSPENESQKISTPLIVNAEVHYGTATSTGPIQTPSPQSPWTRSYESRIQNHCQDEEGTVVRPRELPTTMNFPRTPRRHSQRSTTTFVEPRERNAKFSAHSSRQLDKKQTNHASSLGVMAHGNHHQPPQHHYLTTKHGDLASSYHAKDREIQMGKYKLTVKGTSHVYNSIWQGSATIVQCSFCQAILQVGTTTKLVFCLYCQEVTPMEVARNVSTSPFLGGGGQQVAVADQDVAQVVQWQEDAVARARKGRCSKTAPFEEES